VKHGSAKRRRAHKTLDKAAVKAGFAGRQELELARALAEELYTDIEAAGLVQQLRFGPPIRIAADPGRREAAARRDAQRKDEKEQIDAYGKKRYLFQLALRRAGEKLDVSDADRPARDALIKTISWLLVDCVPESEPVKRTLAELGRTTGRPKLVRRVAEALFADFERIREQQPGAPEPATQVASPKDEAAGK
jgi:hypothetical protein